MMLKLPRQIYAHLSRHRWAWFLFGIILGWRLFQVRGLALPAWVDSVHHTLLVRLLLEQKRLPDTWAPYLPTVPFYYHFGFHATAAVFAQLSGLTGIKVGQAVLLVGQIWQAGLALGVYALGWMLWKNAGKALIAMLLVGFVAQMPAYYVAWGRYSLLAGITLMILAMAAALDRRTITLALLTAATAVTHHYAFLLLGLFLALLLVLAVEQRKSTLIGGLGGLLVAAPWLWRVLVAGQHFIGVETDPNRLDTDPIRLWLLLGPTRNYLLLGLALVGMVLVMVKLWRARRPEQAVLSTLMGWTCVLLMGMGPWRIGPFRPDYAAIVFFLPTVLLAAEALSHLRRPLLIGGIVLMLTGQGIYETHRIVPDTTILATTADVTAITWIEANTPPDATFLIDTTDWFGVWRGVDGGWWITPLTGRRTTLPPLAYGWGGAEVLQPLQQQAVQMKILASHQGAAYCQQLAAILQQRAATYYYTHSAAPTQCPAAQLVYKGPESLGIYQFQFAITRQKGSDS
jgi:hypothetical protein